MKLITVKNYTIPKTYIFLNALYGLKNKKIKHEIISKNTTPTPITNHDGFIMGAGHYRS